MWDGFVLLFGFLQEKHPMTDMRFVYWTLAFCASDQTLCIWKAWLPMSTAFFHDSQALRACVKSVRKFWRTTRYPVTGAIFCGSFNGLFYTWLMTLFWSLLFFSVEMWRFNTLQRDKSLWMGIQRSSPNLRSLIPTKSGFFLKPSLEEKTAQFNLVLDDFF